MEMLKTAVLLAIFAAITSEATHGGKGHHDAVDHQKNKEYLVNDKGLLCLEDSCVGYAGNENGFLHFVKDYKYTEFKNLPKGKIVANDNIACFNGACIGIKDKKPFMGYLYVTHDGSQTKKLDDIMNLKKDNGFLCLNGACAHMVGDIKDTMHALASLAKQGVNVKMVKKMEICTYKGCETIDVNTVKN